MPQGWFLLGVGVTQRPTSPSCGCATRPPLGAFVFVWASPVSPLLFF